MSVETGYELIPMTEIEDEARLIAVRWHENATNWIGDKHKLASDIMNYVKKQVAKAAMDKGNSEVSWDEALKRYDGITPTFLQSPRNSSILEFLKEYYTLTAKPIN